MNSKFRVMSLGGINENGKNAYVIETEKDMVLIEAGSANFTNKSLGINIVLPDFSYILENKNKLRAVLISHGHFDQMGALSYLLDQIDVDVYSSAYTKKFLLQNIKKSKHKFLKEIKYSQALKLGELKVDVFSLSHAIFGNFGFVISNKKNEAVVYATDYNFNQSNNRFSRTDIAKIVELAKNYKVIALLTESISADNVGVASQDKKFMESFDRTIEEARGRLIIALYSSNLAGMTNIIQSAEKYDKKIVIIGRDLLNYLNIAREEKYFFHKKNVFIRISDMNKYDEEDLIIVVAGLHSEPYLELIKMSNKTHNIVNLKDSDTVLIAAKPYDEIESMAQETLDYIARTHCKIKSQTLNVPSHAYKEDIKMLINLFNPNYIIPIKGEYRKLKAIQKFAPEIGYKEESVFIIENGDVLELFEEFAAITDNFILDEQLITSSNDAVNPILLKDRELLADNGYVIIVLTYSKETKNIVQKPHIISGGLIDFNHKDELVQNLINLVLRELEKDHSQKEVLNKIKNKVSRFLLNVIGKTPLVLPMKIFVDESRSRGNNGKKKEIKKENKQ